MNDPRLEIAIERAMQAEAEYERIATANRAHNRRMLIITCSVALLIVAAVIVLAALWMNL